MNKSAESDLAQELSKQRRTVDFDTFDFAVRQLLSMLEDGAIDIAPAYQRQFRWDDERCSQLIESIYLGIPIPSLFMATNKDGTWELVDGVQRISAVVRFLGGDKLRKRFSLKKLRLTGLEKLASFSGMTFEELPRALQVQLELRPLKVITLSDKSDSVVRFDLFERLNKGGVTLTEQEIRDCVFRGPFSKLLGDLAEDSNFKRLVRLTPKQETDGTRKECVLRFFAFLHSYKSFSHEVARFLTDYMRDASSISNHRADEKIFINTFSQLAVVMPEGIRRLATRRKITPINLFEGVAVGAALAIKEKKRVSQADPYVWLESDELKEFTTQATNSPKAVRGRIEYCRDRFLGSG